jgi:hypothetical protein
MERMKEWKDSRRERREGRKCERRRKWSLDKRKGKNDREKTPM